MRPTATDARSTSRRNVLRAGVGLALAGPAVEAFAMKPGRQPGRTLMLLRLAGGNDGLNTVIPYREPLYRELRPTLSWAADGALPINGHLALHAALRPLMPLYEQGRVTIVPGVGAEEADYSHRGACRLWAGGGVARGEDDAVVCWWSRVFAERAGRPPRTMWIGWQDRKTEGIESEGVAVAPRHALADPMGTGSLAYHPGVARQTLRMATRLALSPQAPDLLFASIGGFDTHSDQLNSHARILRELADGIAAMQSAFPDRAAADRVRVMIWSEFGRRPAENASGGTDHGSAGPVILVGGGLPGGLCGSMPSLREVDPFGTLRPTTSIEALCSALADTWLSPAGSSRGSFAV